MTSRSAVSCVERVLVPDRLRGLAPSPPGPDRCPCARSTSDGAVLAEPPLERIRRQRGEVADRLDPELAQHRGGLLAHAPQPRDRQRREERRLLARRHDHQPVGLAQVGRRSSPPASWSPRRPRPSGPTSSWTVRLDRPRDRLAVAEQGARPGHVEERLVDRDRLHLGREPAEDRHDLAAHGLVLAPVDRQEDALRAQPARRPQRHRGVDAELRAPRSSPPRRRRAGRVRRRRRSPACPRSSGRSRCSTAAKNASRSTWRIVRVVTCAILRPAAEAWSGDVETRHADPGPDARSPGSANGPGESGGNGVAGARPPRVSPWARRRS